jgi:hypothetical protein
VKFESLSDGELLELQVMAQRERERREAIAGRSLGRIATNGLHVVVEDNVVYMDEFKAERAANNGQRT